MTTAYTSLLGLALPVTGELSGQWGTTVNDSITSLLDSAVAGTTNLSTDADVTLTTTTGAANTAREAVLLFSGARTAIRTVTAPAQSKIYTVINATTGGFAVKLVGAGPTTGLSIPAGASAVVAWNGSDFIEIGSTTLNSLVVSGNLTVNGTSLFTGISTFTATPVFNGGTANGVGYLNASKQFTTGTALAFDGTNFKVGIGGAGQIQIGTASSASFQTALYSSNGVDTDFQVRFKTGLTDIGLSTATGLSFSISNSEQMRLISTGLGIGTSSPGAKLHVLGSMRQQNATDGNDTLKFLNAAGGTLADLYGYGTSYFTIQSGSNIQLIYNSTGASGFHRWQVNSSDVMRLDSSGNLGIGTSSFSNKLTVQNTDATVWAANTSNPQVMAYNSTSTNNATSLFGATVNYGDGTYTGVKFGAVASAAYSADFVIANRNVGTFQENLRLTYNGNLGLGVTPSAWGSSTRAIDVNLSASLSSRTDAFRCLLSNNAYNDNTNWRYKYTGVAALLYQQDGGVHSWLNATSGTAGAAISFTQAMTLDASGNLLVGTTDTSVPTQGFAWNINSGASFGRIGHVSGTTSGTAYLAFQYAGSVIGTVTQAGTTGVLYNVTSDYRLKNIAGPVANSGEFIDKLNPVQGSWKADGSRFIGFLAHELQEASETVVGTGVKDGADMQSIDYSNAELIANLVAELKSLRARVAQLESK